MSPANQDIERQGGAALSGVAVVLAPMSATQLHVGLRYEHEDAERVVHLAWYLALRCADRACFVDKRYRDQWAKIDLDLCSTEAESVIAICEGIKRWSTGRDRSARYGLLPERAEIAADGTIPVQSEFTCATFVLAVLRSGGVDLVDLARWPDPTEEDRTWQRETASALAAYVAFLLPRLEGPTREQAQQDQRSFESGVGVGSKLCPSDEWPVASTRADERGAEIQFDPAA